MTSQRAEIERKQKGASERLFSPSTMGCPVVWPCSMSSYSTLKPDTVSEAETQEMTKLLEVISVTDSEVSTTGGGGVVSPWEVATAAGEERGVGRVSRLQEASRLPGGLT